MCNLEQGHEDSDHPKSVNCWTSREHTGQSNSESAGDEVAAQRRRFGPNSVKRSDDSSSTERRSSQKIHKFSKGKEIVTLGSTSMD